MSHVCAGVIPNTCCGEGDNYCSDECWAWGLAASYLYPKGVVPTERCKRDQGLADLFLRTIKDARAGAVVKVLRYEKQIDDRGELAARIVEDK